MSAIGFKDLKVLKSMFLNPWHPKLIALLLWLIVRYSKDKIIVTCAYEERNYSSVHFVIPLRGFDIRSWVFKNPAAIVDDINQHWIYDPRRPALKCAMYHDTGRGKHIHLQIHPNTKCIDGGIKT